MSRQLIAGQTPERNPRAIRITPRLFDARPELEPVRVPRLTTFPSQQAAADELAFQLTELEALHQRSRELADRMLRLQAKLADPDLFLHPRRRDAETKYELLISERNESEGRKQAVLMVIGKTYCALARETRDELMSTGWAPSETPEQVRSWLESCLAVGWLPHREAPF